VTRATLLVLTAALVAGCGSSPKSRFYTLSANGAASPPAAAAGAASPAAAAAYSVSVGPVSVPEIVDRPQFVLNVGTNQVEIAEQARWAEPLKAAIPRVIAANLAHALGDARVTAFSADADYRVLVDIQRFESVRSNAVSIEAGWSVRPAKGGAPRNGRSVVRETASGKDFDALAAAHSKALAVLSDEIAQAIRAHEVARK
jgi:uncharacterized lipoprotein YmbA